MGKEFIYRAPVYVKLEEFCKNLREVMTSILPEKTPIDLVLDDGRAQDSQKRKNPRRQLGAVPREPITIKVTPLKPLLSREKCLRGSAEWFYRQTEIADFSFTKATNALGTSRPTGQSSSRQENISRNRFQSRTFSSTGFGRPTDAQKTFRSMHRAGDDLNGGGEEIGVNRFSFTQPRDKLRGTRDLLKSPNGDVSEKSLRVTELLVSQNMPNCVTRQPVAVENRSVFNQSPIEAGVEAVCSWCGVLFRTAVATNGLAVIGDRGGHGGIGTAAIKVIAECIHRSKVKEIGLVMLKPKESDDVDAAERILSLYEKLSKEEFTSNQVKLARAVVIFMELLHVLIGRNRDLLLTANEARKRRDASSSESYSARGGLQFGIPPSPGPLSFINDVYNRTYDDGTSTYYGGGSTTSTMDRTDKAMAVQRELQKSFIGMTKALYPALFAVIHSETPRWMRHCQDNYFSSGSYRQTRIAIGKELLFFGNASDRDYHQNEGLNHNESFGIPLSILPTQSGSSNDHDSFAESMTSRTNSRTSSRGESPSTSFPI